MFFFFLLSRKYLFFPVKQKIRRAWFFLAGMRRGYVIHLACQSSLACREKMALKSLVLAAKHKKRSNDSLPDSWFNKYTFGQKNV